MGMKKRITENRSVIARVDDALTGVPLEKLQEYYKALDIKGLGDLSSLSDQPTIWDITPLKAKYAHLDRGDDNGPNDFWNIFSLHVNNATNCPVDLVREGAGDSSSLKDSVRSEIPEDFIEDIARIILQLAKGDGTYVPFEVQRGLLGIQSHHRVTARAPAPRVTVAKPAPSEGVKPNGSDTN